MQGNSSAWSNSDSFLSILNGGLVLQNEKDSIDVDDLFKKKALTRWNEKHNAILLRRTCYFLQHKAKSMAAQFILLSQKKVNW